MNIMSNDACRDCQINRSGNFFLYWKLLKNSLAGYAILN